jgi:ABC-type branched-subunit amino acid transport system substrate-binding protein
VLLDDGGVPAVARRHAERLLDEAGVDLLLGPYGSGLTRAVLPVAAGRRRVLWNHGGAADLADAPGGEWAVPVLAPAGGYLAELPGWLRRTRAAVRRLAVLHRARPFGREVAAGLAAAAAREGLAVRLVPFESATGEPAALLAEAARDAPDAVAVAGRLEDDLALVGARARLGPDVVLAAVAAGLDAFGRLAGAAAEGVLGPVQWLPGPGPPPALGPPEAWLVAAVRRRLEAEPEYPAAQAFAAALVAAACLERAGSADGAALRAAAHGLDATTLLGRFRLDPVTGRQVGHRARLVRWQGGVRRRVA